jgi:hypothetical protein
MRLEETTWETGVVGSVILKRMLKKYICSGEEPVAGSYERGNEHWGSINGWEFLDGTTIDFSIGFCST